MSLSILAAGSLVADPQRREGQSGEFASASIRVEDDAGKSTLVSLIAFGDEVDRLLALGKGDSLAVSGRARLTGWTGRDGAEKHDISVIAEQLASLKSTRRPGLPNARRNRHSRLPSDRVDDLWRGPSA